MRSAIKHLLGTQYCRLYFANQVSSSTMDVETINAEGNLKECTVLDCTTKDCTTDINSRISLQS